MPLLDKIVFGPGIRFCSHWKVGFQLVKDGERPVVWIRLAASFDPLDECLTPRFSNRQSMFSCERSEPLVFVLV